MSLRTIFNNVFPPPAYLTAPSIGIDISDRSFKYIRFSGTRNTQDRRIDTWGSIDVPEGAIVRGVIESPQKVVAIMKEICDRCGTPFVRISLPEERAYIFETTIARNTPFNAIRGKLEFSLEQNVPISPRDVIFDYDIVGGKAGDKEFKVVVTAYNKETIQAYYDICTEAGAIPRGFEVEASAIARAVLPEDTQETHMVLDLGKTRSCIGIVHHGVLSYASTIEIGGDTMSEALRDMFGNLSEDALTEVKNTKGIVAGENHHKENKTFDALIPVIDVLVEETMKRIRYWNARDNEPNIRDIGSVVLCGGTANLAGLPEYMSNKLNVPVRLADVWSRAISVEREVPEIDRAHSFGYATAIGLALGDSIFSK